MPYPLSEASRTSVTRLLKEDEILVFPTETVYGLGGNALSAKAVQKVYRTKKRTPDKAMPVLVDQAWLEKLVPTRNERIDELISTFWPGPLTLILQAPPELPCFLKGPGGTLALRWSDSKVVQELIRLGKCPLIGTSANLSGRPECLSAAEVEAQFKERTPPIVDGGILKQTPPSTLLDCSRDRFRLLRTGSLGTTVLKPYL